MSSTTDLDEGYEARVRDSLQAQLFSVLKLGVMEPSEGFNRKFRKEFFSWWKEDWSYHEVEIDFLAHTFFRGSPFTPLDEYQLEANVTFSLSPDVTTTPFVRTRGIPEAHISPEKEIRAEPTEFTDSYVLAEITHGGEKSLKKKIAQLERDCLLLAAKNNLESSESILEIVTLVIVVGIFPFKEMLFKYIQSMSTTFPSVYALFARGRFLYIQNGYTASKMIEILSTNFEEMKQGVVEIKEELEKQLVTMEKQKVEMKEGLGTMEKQLEELTRAVNKILKAVEK